MMDCLLVLLLLVLYLTLVFGLLHFCVIYDMPRSVFGVVVFVASPLVVIGLILWWGASMWSQYQERKRLWKDRDLV